MAKKTELQFADAEALREWLLSHSEMIAVVPSHASVASDFSDFVERMNEFSRSFRLESSFASVVKKSEKKEHPQIERRPVGETEARFRQLQQECEKLRIENQLLLSRVAEERRATARETRQYDQLLNEVNKLQNHNEKLLDCFAGRMKAIDATTALLLEQNNARLRMIERYEGVVEHIHGDSVTVVFEIDDDVVEHTYNRIQFIDGQFPEEGDPFSVYVHVVHGSVETEDETSVETDHSNEYDEYERKKITGPVEF